LSRRPAYLLDTNHLGAAVYPHSPVRNQVVAERRRGIRLGTCVPVLCEIEAGAQQVRDPARFHEQLQRLLRQLVIWPLDRTTARIYGEIYNDLRRRGRVLSQVDMMLAALARQMDLVLLTTDSDFDALPDVRRENWANP
jgi:tRNA(fMet)-specific endonuclease VapC